MSDDEDTPDVPAMTRFPVPDVDDLPEDLRERIEEEEERAGFVPNVFLAYGYRPSHFRSFFGYYDALVDNTVPPDEREEPYQALTRAELEMIVVAVSGANDCYYCNVAHGALVRIYADDPLLADQLVANHRDADLDTKHRRLLDFAVKLTENGPEIGEADFEALRDVGYGDRAIWDAGAVAAFFNLSNRMAQLADMRPNAEIHTLGR